MDGYQNQVILEDPEAFLSYRNIYGIELWRSNDRIKRIFRHGDISEEDFPDWLRQEGKYSPPEVYADEPRAECLRLLACKLDQTLCNWGHTGIPYTGALALGMSRAQYEEAVRQMELPRNFLTLLARQTAAWSRDSAKEHRGGFVLKSNTSHSWHFGMASNHRSASGVTNVFLLGLAEPQLMEFCKCLEHEDMRLPISALTPMLLIELRAQAIWKHVSHSHTQIFHLEGQTGVFTSSTRKSPIRERGFRLSPSGAKVFPGARKSVDYESVTVELTGTITELSHALFTCDVTVRLLDKIPYLTAFTSSTGQSMEQSEADENLRDKIEYLESYYRGLESRANYVMRRAQAQVQTVYSMVAQRDSAASVALAEASRQDNILMRKIAEDSKRVAVATSRDSAAMKIIAAVTILFLPGTFVATLFSTSFFNFQQPGKVVSWWVWLYWVVAVVLTVAIHLAWYFISRNKEQEIEQKFGGTDERDDLPPIVEVPKL